MQILVMMIVGGFFLFLIIACAVKMAVKEALYEFKEDVIKELGLKKTNEDKNEN